jgi:hypothetical protein
LIAKGSPPREVAAARPRKSKAAGLVPGVPDAEHPAISGGTAMPTRRGLLLAASTTLVSTTLATPAVALAVPVPPA